MHYKKLYPAERGPCLRVLSGSSEYELNTNSDQSTDSVRDATSHQLGRQAGSARMEGLLHTGTAWVTCLWHRD